MSYILWRTLVTANVSCRKHLSVRGRQVDPEHIKYRNPSFKKKKKKPNLRETLKYNIVKNKVVLIKVREVTQNAASSATFWEILGV